MVRSLEYLIHLPIPWDRRTLRLNETCVKDLIWWKKILVSKHNSLPFSYVIKPASEADIHVWTDAAGSTKLGIGAFNSLGDYFSCKWSDVSLPANWNLHDSLRPELLALMVAAIIWAPKFAHKAVTFHCDNLPIVSIIISRSPAKHRKDILYLIRILTEIALFHHYYFWVTHIPGDLNIEADALSRLFANPLKRLLSHPNDSHIQPFFDINPHYPFKFNWKETQVSDLLNQLCNEQFN